MLRLTPSSPKDLELFKQSVNDVEVNVLDPPAGPCLNPTYYSIYAMPEDKCIGLCVFYNYSGGLIEYGIRIWEKSFWGKGYGTRATILACEEALVSNIHNMPIFTIVVKVLPVNTRAIRCYEKAGFKKFAKSTQYGYDFIWMAKSLVVL